MAGASGVNTGIMVRAFTSSAACGFQNSAVANQSPSTVVDSSSGSATGAVFIRSRSFLVPRTISIGSISAPLDSGTAFVQLPCNYLPQITTKGVPMTSGVTL